MWENQSPLLHVQMYYQTSTKVEALLNDLLAYEAEHYFDGWDIN